MYFACKISCIVLGAPTKFLWNLLSHVHACKLAYGWSLKDPCCVHGCDEDMNKSSSSARTLLLVSKPLPLLASSSLLDLMVLLSNCRWKWRGKEHPPWNRKSTFGFKLPEASRHSDTSTYNLNLIIQYKFESVFCNFCLVISPRKIFCEQKFPGLWYIHMYACVCVNVAWTSYSCHNRTKWI